MPVGVVRLIHADEFAEFVQADSLDQWNGLRQHLRMPCSDDSCSVSKKLQLPGLLLEALLNICGLVATFASWVWAMVPT